MLLAQCFIVDNNIKKYNTWMVLSFYVSKVFSDTNSSIDLELLKLVEKYIHRERK